VPDTVPGGETAFAARLPGESPGPIQPAPATVPVDGGDATGPSPVDRRKLGSKHTSLVDANGVPIVIRTAPANASDYKPILPVVVTSRR
jgi:hypothetical protein